MRVLVSNQPTTFPRHILAPRCDPMSTPVPGRRPTCLQQLEGRGITNTPASPADTYWFINDKRICDRNCEVICISCWAARYSAKKKTKNDVQIRGRAGFYRSFLISISKFSVLEQKKVGRQKNPETKQKRANGSIQ